MAGLDALIGIAFPINGDDTMEPTSLSNLLEEDGVTCSHNGLIVTVHPSWIVEGEDRLSYTSLVRLVECCRECHWMTDILPRATDTPLDSITKTIAGSFMKPIPIGAEICIAYCVTDVRRKGYSLRFLICDEQEQTVHAEVELVSIFFDPVQNRAIAPPHPVHEYLQSLRDATS